MNLRQIAAEAGCSLTAVSLVLNGKRGVGAEKREKITRLLLANGYVLQGDPPPAESGKTVCFVRCICHGHLINGNPGFTTQILDAAEAQCRRFGYSLQVITIQKSETDAGTLSQILNAENIVAQFFWARKSARMIRFPCRSSNSPMSLSTISCPARTTAASP